MAAKSKDITFKVWYEKNSGGLKKHYDKYATEARAKKEFPDPMIIWACELFNKQLTKE